jgi:Insecticidal Crystal Toxin, P42/Ricin-type beta-trefoil lectin domain-like
MEKKMNKEDTFGRTYQIVAEHSGKVLDLATILDPNFDPPFSTQQPFPPFSKRHLIQFESHGGKNQQFLLFPQDDGTYVIANRHTGEVLDIARASLDDSTPCIGHPFKSPSQSNQTFNLKVINGSLHFIEAKHSGKILDVFKAKKQNRVRVFQHHLKDGTNQKFRFEVVGEYLLPATSQLGVLGPVPSATSVDDILPDDTPPVLREEVRVPYFAVNDTLDRALAVNTSPYYLIKNEQFWHKSFERRYEGSAVTDKYTVESGMTESISVSVEAHFSLEKLKDIFDLNLTFKANTNQTRTQTVTMEREFSYGGGAAVHFVAYVLVDRFRMQRTDGTVIGGPWEVTNGDIIRQRAFPNVPA